RENLPKYKDLA
ncbi:hypothetical protein E0I42_28890, partial [Escherichia coli]